MRSTSLKQRLAEGRLTLGSWMALGSEAVAEILAGAGFEWLVVDLEHSGITLREAERMIRVSELAGAAPLVRLSDNDPVQVKRVMDAGTQGIVVPMVNSVQDAERAVEAMHYPPRGGRGVGLARAQVYGAGFEAYKSWLAEESVLVVQVEHVRAVENLEAILAVEGVDAFIVGPYDLSGSLGIPGDFEHPRMLEAMDEIARVANFARPAAGFHVVLPRPELVKEKIAQGYTFIAYSVDFLFLGQSARDGLAAISRDSGGHPS